MDVTPDTAAAIWDALTKHAGAPEHGRAAWLRAAAEGGLREYTFAGALLGPDARLCCRSWRVDVGCGEETAQRVAIVAVVNGALSGVTARLGVAA